MSAGSIRAVKAFVEIDVNDKRLKSGLNKAKVQLQSFANSAKSIGSNMLGVGAAITAPFALAAREFAGFEQEMKTVAAVTQATGREFDALNEQAKELGLTTTFTATAVAGAMVQLGRAGFAASEFNNEIGMAIPNVLALARATGTDLTEAARITAATLRGFGLEASESERVVDALTATSIKSAQTVEGLGDALKFVGPFARQAGSSLEQTSAALGILADNGIRGTIAGTGLARIFKNLSQQAKIDFLNDLGVDVKDNIGNFRSVTRILSDLFNKTKKMGSVERVSIFEQLFGRGAASAITLAQNSKAVDSLTKKIRDLEGVAKRTAATMDDSLAGSFRLATSAAQGLAISVGEAIAPALRMLIGVFRKVAFWVESFVKEWQILTTVIAGGGAILLVVGGLTLFVGVMASLLANIVVVVPLLLAMGVGLGVITGTSTAASVAVAAFAASTKAAVIAAAPLVLALGWITAALAGIALISFAVGVVSEINEISAATDRMNKKTEQALKNMDKLSEASKTGRHTTEASAAQEVADQARGLARAGSSAREISEELQRAADIQKKVIEAMRERLRVGKKRVSSTKSEKLSELEIEFTIGEIKGIKKVIAARESLSKVMREEIDAAPLINFVKIMERARTDEAMADRLAISQAAKLNALREETLSLAKQIANERREALSGITSSRDRALTEQGLDRRRKIADEMQESNPMQAVASLKSELAAAINNTAKVWSESISQLQSRDLAVSEAESIQEVMEGALSSESLLRGELERAVSALSSRQSEAKTLVESVQEMIRGEAERRFGKGREARFQKAIDEDPKKVLDSLAAPSAKALAVLEEAGVIAKKSAENAERTGEKSDLEQAKRDKEMFGKRLDHAKTLEGFTDRAKEALKGADIEESVLGTFSLAQAQGFAKRSMDKVQVEQLDVAQQQLAETKKNGKLISKIDSGLG